MCVGLKGSEVEGRGYDARDNVTCIFIISTVENYLENSYETIRTLIIILLIMFRDDGKDGVHRESYERIVGQAAGCRSNSSNTGIGTATEHQTGSRLSSRMRLNVCTDFAHKVSGKRNLIMGLEDF